MSKNKTFISLSKNNNFLCINIILLLFIFSFSGCNYSKYFLKQDSVMIDVPQEQEIDSLLDDAYQFYNKGKYGDALRIYKKILVLDPDNPLVEFRINEIKKWVTLVKRRDDTYRKKIENLKARNLEKMNKVIEDKTLKEEELAKEKTERQKIIDKTKALDLLYEAGIALVDHKFEKARGLTKKSMIIYPDVEGVNELLGRISKAESEWIIVRNLIQVDKKVKKENFSIKKKEKKLEKEKKEEDLLKKQAEIFQKQKEKIIERSVDSEVEEIVKDEFKFKEISRFNKKAKMSEMEHLKVQSLRVYEKIINDYEIDKNNDSLKIDEYTESQLNEFFKGISGAYYWIGKYYYNQDNFKKASRYLLAIIKDKNLEEYNYYFSAYYLVGSIQLKINKLKKAYMSFEKIIDGIPEEKLKADKELFDFKGEKIEENLLYIYKESYKKWAQIRRKSKNYNLNIVLQLYQDILDKFYWNEEVVDEIMVLMGETYIEKNEFTSALEIFEKILEKGRGSSQYEKSYFYKALILAKMEKFDESRLVLKDIFINDPLNRMKADSLYFYGETFFLEQSFSQAIIYIKKAYDEFPDYYDRFKYLILLAKSYMTVGLSDSAIDIFETLIDNYDFTSKEAKPAYLKDAFYELAKAYQVRSRYADARKKILQLSVEFPKSELARKARYLLADIYFDTEKYTLADKQYKIAFSLDSNKKSLEAFISKYKRAVALNKLKKHDFLLKFYDDVFSFNDFWRDEWDVSENNKRKQYFDYYYKMLFEYAVFLMDLKKYDQAISNFLKIYTENVDGEYYYWSKYLIAKAYELTSRKEDAIINYQDLIKGDKSNFWVQQGEFNLNNLLWNDKHKEAALKVKGE